MESRSLTVSRDGCRITALSILFFAASLICRLVGAEETKNQAADEPCILLINFGAVPANMLETIRSFAEQELKVAVKAKQAQPISVASFSNALASITDAKDENAVRVIAFFAPTVSAPHHLHVSTNTGIAAINVPALGNDNAKISENRLIRQVMRAAAFLFDIQPAPDPLCVTRNYKDLADLDMMGLNYSPPVLDEFKQRARASGLKIIEQRPPRPGHGKKPPTRD